MRRLSGERVLVIPSMYADFIAYNAPKAVVWGGHSGDLTKFEEFFRSYASRWTTSSSVMPSTI